jgi:uncharacterized protein
MKYLLVLIVVVVGGWLLLRGRVAPPRPRQDRRAERDTMVACAHCGVHLPRSETVTDGQGRPFCSDAHRLAGPR